jgi:hypothetical protein
MDTRKELKNRDGQRFRCRAVVDRFGTKTAFRGPPVRTILLRNVVDTANGTLMADHLWFTAGKWSAPLAVGCVFEFEARSGDYIKGYRGHRDNVFDAPVCRDWKLQRPTKVVIIPQGERAAA